MRRNLGGGYLLNNKGYFYAKEKEGSYPLRTGIDRVMTTDFDQDGDMDYVAGNFGLNSQLKTSVDYPIGIYAKDYDNNGSVDPILSCYDEGKRAAETLFNDYHKQNHVKIKIVRIKLNMGPAKTTNIRWKTGIVVNSLSSFLIWETTSFF